jgi:hypothetical protein
LRCDDGGRGKRNSDGVSREEREREIEGRESERESKPVLVHAVISRQCRQKRKKK